MPCSFQDPNGKGLNWLVTSFLLPSAAGYVIHDPIAMYKQIQTEVRKSVQTRPRDYCISLDREVEIAAMRLAGMRDIQFQPASRLN